MGGAKLFFPIFVTRGSLAKGLEHCEYIALVLGEQDPKVQISSSLNRLQLEDNVPFYVEFTVEDILIPITMFSVCNDAH